MGNLSIRKKIFLSLSVLIAGYVVLLILVVVNTARTADYIARTANELLPADLSSQEAEAAFRTATRLYQDAVVLQDARSLKTADADMAAALLALETLKASTPHLPVRRASANAIIASIHEVRSTAARTYPALIEHPDAASPETLAVVTQLAVERKAIAANLSALRQQTFTDFGDELNLTSLRARNERKIGILCSLVAAIWAIGSLFLLQKQVISPIQALAFRLRNIAEGDGDLSRRLVVHGTDETGQVATYFNVFMDQLQALLREVASASVQLAEATREISVGSAQTARAAERQDLETRQITDSMHEMAKSVADVSESSVVSAEKVANALELARNGGLAVNQTVATMLEVSNSVEAAALTIQQLGEQSNQISRITRVIENIAGKTQMLAFNAAIEASRAGAEGRGFAVLATEVRALAGQTAQSTSDIRSMLLAVQSGTRSAVETMQRSTSQVQLGVESALATGTGLEDIISAIEQGSNMIARVAAAAGQQAAGTRHVETNVARIASSTKESNLGAQESARSAAELANLAAKLGTMISRFKLEEAPPNNPPIPSPNTYPSTAPAPTAA